MLSFVHGRVHAPQFSRALLSVSRIVRNTQHEVDPLQGLTIPINISLSEAVIWVFLGVPDAEEILHTASLFHCQKAGRFLNAPAERNRFHSIQSALQSPCFGNGTRREACYRITQNVFMLLRPSTDQDSGQKLLALIVPVLNATNVGRGAVRPLYERYRFVICTVSISLCIIQ